MGEHFIVPSQQYMQTAVYWWVEPPLMVIVKLKDKSMKSVQ